MSDDCIGSPVARVFFSLSCTCGKRWRIWNVPKRGHMGQGRVFRGEREREMDSNNLIQFNGKMRWLMSGLK
jgi:hypothetical protein